MAFYLFFWACDRELSISYGSSLAYCLFVYSYPRLIWGKHRVLGLMSSCIIGLGLVLVHRDGGHGKGMGVQSSAAPAGWVKGYPVGSI